MATSNPMTKLVENTEEKKSFKELFGKESKNNLAKRLSVWIIFFSERTINSRKKTNKKKNLSFWGI